MIRKKKKFSWPRKLFDKTRITEENKLVLKYGLKNKREIWRTDAKIKYFRNRAKSLITADQNEQKKFFDNLRMIGFKVDSISDVLALNIEDLLKRRLSSILQEKNLASTPKLARQMITHKKILIGNRIVDVPSYIVKINEEDSISLKKSSVKVKKKPEEKVEEVNVEKVEEVKADA